MSNFEEVINNKTDNCEVETFSLMEMRHEKEIKELG